MNGLTHEQIEFARTILQGLVAAIGIGKFVVEAVKGLARRKAAKTALVERVVALESENVILRAQLHATRIDLARESEGREREARVAKRLTARARAEKDDGEEIEIHNVTFLKDERP